MKRIPMCFSRAADNQLLAEAVVKLTGTVSNLIRELIGSRPNESEMLLVYKPTTAADLKTKNEIIKSINECN